jgi:hypothetical protein
MMIHRFTLSLLLMTVGCASQPDNPSFPLSNDQAQRALAYMSEHPRALRRPLVVIGGFWDLYTTAPLLKWHFHDISGDARIIAVSVAYCGSFDDCRQTVLDAVDRAFPNTDPQFTTEVDVVGGSLGGLAARFAAAPSPDPAKPRRLRIARLFSIASPHSGATLAEYFGFTSFHNDMRPGSEFLKSLGKSDVDATYQLYPYVLLGDGIVGQQYAAPPNRLPIWLPTTFLESAHIGALSDPRIIADIARRLRGEPPFSHTPLTPLPDSSAPSAPISTNLSPTSQNSSSAGNF